MLRVLGEAYIGEQGILISKPQRVRITHFIDREQEPVLLAELHELKHRRKVPFHAEQTARGRRVIHGGERNDMEETGTTGTRTGSLPIGDHDLLLVDALGEQLI